MYEPSSRPSGVKTKGFQLHAVLRDFHRFEKEKSVVRNRINIMSYNQQQNLKKATTIQMALDRRRRNKQERVKQTRALLKQRDEDRAVDQNEKKRKVLMVLQSENGTQESKRLYSEHKKMRSWNIRSEKRILEERMLTNREETMREKSLQRSRIREQMSQSRIRKEAFRQSKISYLKSLEAEQLLNQKAKNRDSQSELKELKRLEQEVMTKYSESIASLRSSRSQFKHLR